MDYQFPTSAAQRGIVAAVILTADYAVLLGDASQLLLMNSASPHTFTLPATPPANGWLIYFQNIGAGVATVSGNGNNIDSSSTLALSTGEGVTVVSNGTNYSTQRGVSLVKSVAGHTGVVTLTAADVSGVEIAANKDAASGYAGLDSNTKLKTTELPSRVTTVFNSAIIANGVVDSGSWVMGKSVIVLAVTVNVDSRVRLYSTAAARDADVSRGGIPPTSGTQSEVILDLALAAATTGLVWVCTPAATGCNGDSSPSTSIYYNVTNNSGSTQAVQVTIKFLILES